MSKRKEDPKRYCRHCGQILRRQRIGDRLEDFGVFTRRKYCDRTCMAQGMVKPKASRSTYLYRARRHRKPACEECGATDRLHVHHKDKNWRNNDPLNLVTLCSSCHLKVHWADGKHVAKRRTVIAHGLDGLLGFCNRIAPSLAPADAAEMREHIANLWARLPAE